MGVPGLRRAASGSRLRRKQITLEDRDFPEMLGESLSGRKAGHAGADHDGMSSCNMCHVCLPKKICEIRSKMDSGRDARGSFARAQTKIT